jgi:hypothetical protein
MDDGNSRSVACPAASCSLIVIKASLQQNLNRGREKRGTAYMTSECSKEELEVAGELAGLSLRHRWRLPLLMVRDEKLSPSWRRPNFKSFPVEFDWNRTRAREFRSAFQERGKRAYVRAGEIRCLSALLS